MEIEETDGYKLAIAFKPFIDPKCTEHIEIVKDMARSINRLVESKSMPNYDKMTDEIEKLKLALSFEKGERILVKGLHYQKGINENSFYNAIS